MNHRFFIVAGALLLLTLPGCVGGGGARGGSGESLNQQVARHDQQIQTLLSQVGQVEQVLPGQAEMWSQMQTMRQELNGVQGKLEDLNAQTSGEGTGEFSRLRDTVGRLESVVRQMASQLAINVDSLDAGGAHVSGGSTTPSGGVVVPPAGGGSGEPTASEKPVDTATTLYDTGIKSFDQRRYKDAVVSFKDFVSAFPKHKLAGNAHFWEGESYFQLKDYPRAALAYQEVIVNFPGSPKVQSAMLKQGISLYSAGKKDAATQRLQELVKRYPSSPEATRAKDFMQKNK